MIDGRGRGPNLDAIEKALPREEGRMFRLRAER